MTFDIEAMFLKEANQISAPRVRLVAFLCAWFEHDVVGFGTYVSLVCLDRFYGIIGQQYVSSR